MKHLKKILVALVLVAMITSSVIVVALANNYTGTVAGASELYENYENAEATSKLSLEDVKAGALADLYLYFKTSPIDPSSAGYNELIASYNSAVVKVAYRYLANLAAANTTDDKASIMTNLYVLFASAPLYSVNDYSVPLSYKCAVEAHTEPTVVLLSTAEQFYAGIPADASCSDGCDPQTQVIAAASEVKYSDIYKQAQALNVDITDLVVNKLFEKVADAETRANYFELGAVREALDIFLTSYPDLSIAIPDGVTVYTGSISVVEAKLSALNANGKFEDIKAGLADIYNYLVANPVSPSSESFAEFNESYNALCDKFMQLFKAEVDSEYDPVEKVKLFNEMYLFLAGSPDDPETTDVNEEVAPKFISERVVNIYNNMRDEVIGEYDDMILDIGSSADFTEAIPQITYNVNDLTTFKGYITTAKRFTPPSATANPSTVATLFRMQIYKYLNTAATNKIDPTVVGYAEVMADYNVICDYLIEDFATKVTNAQKLGEKYSALQNFCTFLRDYPVSDAAIKRYNEVRSQVIEAYRSYYGAVSLEGLMPSFKQLDAVVTNVTAETLNSLLSDIKNAYNAYSAAEIEDKPAAFETWKTATVSMHSFLSAVTIASSAPFIATFSAEYGALCESLVNELLASVDAESEPELKAAALADVKSFLVSAPLSSSVVKLYNDKVDAVYAGDEVKIAEEKLVTVFFSAIELAEKIETYPESIASFKTAYDDAKSDLDKKQSALDAAAEELANIKAEIATLEEQIAAAEAADEDPSVIEGYRTTLSTKQNDLATASTALDTATQEFGLSKAAFMTAEANYEKAYEDFRNDAKALQNIYETIYAESKTADSYYATFIAKYENAAAVVSAVIKKNVEDAINGTDMDYTVKVITLYAEYLSEVNYKTAIEQFNTTVTDSLSDTKNKLEYLEDNNAEVEILYSAFDGIRDLMADYRNAETYEAKKSAFVTLHSAISNIQITIRTVETAYAPLMAEYQEICDDLAALLIASLNGHADIVSQYNAAKDVRDFITLCNFSDEVAAAYNRAFAALKEQNIDDLPDILAAGTAVITYESPENTLNTFPELGQIVNGADVDAIELEKYFITFSAKAQGSLPSDVLSAGFQTAFAEYTLALKQYIANAEAEYNAIDADEGRIEKLNALIDRMYKEVGKITVTTEIAEIYLSIKEEIATDYRVNIKATFLKYKKLVADVHAYLQSCPVDRYSVDDALYDRYKQTLVKVEGAEYAEALAYIFDFNNATGNIPAVTMNSAYNSVKKYVANYGLDEQFTYKKFTDVLLCDMMNALLDTFDESIATLGDIEREKEIANLAFYIGRQSFPEVLCDMFEDRYGVTVTEQLPDAAIGEGTVEGFAEYFTAFAEQTKLDDMKTYLTLAVTYLNENPISNVTIYEDISIEISKMSATLDKALEVAKEAAQKNANFNDYNLGYQMNYDMENGKAYTTSLANNSDQGCKVNIKSEPGNKYASVEYAPNTSGQYFNVTKFDSSSSFVLEFDLMAPDVENNFSTFYLNATEWGINHVKNYGEVSKARVTSKFIAFDENGMLKYIAGDYSNKRDDQGFPNYQEGVDDPIYLESGQWMHISIIVDVVKYEVELVINYTSLGRKPLIVAGSSTGEEDTCNFTELRFQGSGNTTYCYDNLRIYTGNSYRDPERFTSKTDAELFNFYVDYAADDTNSTVNRISAYYSASGLIDKATSEEHKKKFTKISVDEILASAQIHYREELVKLAEPLKDGAVTTANYSEKETAIAALRAYIKTNQAYMDQSSDWFGEINDLVLAAEAQIEWVQNLISYADSLPLFQRAPTLTALKKHAATADKYYKLCNLDDPAALALANEDAVIKDVIAQLKLNDDVALVIGDDIGKYHNVYMPARIQLQTYTENAQKLIECVDAIELLVPAGTAPDKFNEVLLQKAQENVDYVNGYMVAMRPVVVSEEYDEEYPGIEETLAVYNLLDEMFYKIVQEAHYVLLEEQIARYKATNSYIERAGICTYIENYIAANSVDILSQRGALINYTVSVYKAELVTYKGEYEAILEANTNSFISLVERMKAYTSYGELKPLYTEAIENYYYNMNVDSDAAKAAIETFAIYEQMIQDWELSSKLFIDYSANLKSARRPAQIYRALVNCAKYVDGANTEVEGVNNALKVYEEKLADYNESIAATNGDISASIDIVCSVRTSTVASTVLAIIKSIFTK